MGAFSTIRFKAFARIAAVSVVLGLGANGPALATDMICSNVSSMESAIAGTTCCSGSGFGQAIACWVAGGSSQCALSSGPLQACCDDASDTEGEQTACLCGQVAGYSNYALGFTPEGC